MRIRIDTRLYVDVIRRSAIIDVELAGQTAAQVAAWSLLASAQGLIADPATMDQQPAVVVHDQEEPAFWLPGAFG